MQSRRPSSKNLAGHSQTGRMASRRNPSRRRVIQFTLILVAAASSAISWAVIRPSLIERSSHQAPLEWQAHRWDRLRLCSVTPEYDRTMKQVVVTLAKSDTTLGLHHEILLRLPPYARIICLLDQTNLEAVKIELKDKPYGDRVELVPYDGKAETGGRYYFLFAERDKLVQIRAGDGHRLSRQGSHWAQDLFEVTVAPAGELVLLTSEVHKYYSTVGAKSALQVVRDNVHLARLGSIGVEVQPLPIAFMGGNLLVDVMGGKPIAFCGGDVLRTTRTVHRTVFDSEPTTAEITGFIRAILNVESVVIIGRERPQPRQVFHLDQAMTLLHDGVAAITRVVAEESGTLPDHDDIKQVQRFLTELRSVLQALGYRLINIDTSVRNIMSCAHYVNTIPYVDAQTGQRTILFPTFPASETDFEKQLVDRNTASLESLGYRVVRVPTTANELRGGIHCLVNILE